MIGYAIEMLGAEEAIAALSTLAGAARDCAKTVGQSARHWWRLKCSTRGKKRPGQWSWQTRMRRARRQRKADRRQREAQTRTFPPRPNRRARRRGWRTGVEWRALDLGLAPLPNESTAALFARVMGATP